MNRSAAVATPRGGHPRIEHLRVVADGLGREVAAAVGIAHREHAPRPARVGRRRWPAYRPAAANAALGESPIASGRPLRRAGPGVNSALRRRPPPGVVPEAAVAAGVVATAPRLWHHPERAAASGRDERVGARARRGIAAQHRRRRRRAQRPRGAAVALNATAAHRPERRDRRRRGARRRGAAVRVVLRAQRRKVSARASEHPAGQE